MVSNDLVERRRRYIERQRVMKPETVNVRSQGMEPSAEPWFNDRYTY